MKQKMDDAERAERTAARIEEVFREERTLTDAVRLERAEQGDALAAASDFEFWARCFIPDADEAMATAKARGLIFGADARDLILSSVADARRCFQLLTQGAEGEAMRLEDFEKARAQSEAATARAKTCIDLACAALRGIADGKGGAAKLARGAIADFLNCLAADDAEAATREAFKAANDAARAYFVTRGDWNGGPKRKHPPKSLVAKVRKVLEDMGNPQLTQGYGRETEAALAQELARRGIFTADDSPEMPRRVLNSIYNADNKAAQRKRKPH